MGALDEAIARHPFIDPDRLGVLGGSYGGFLTSWTVGHSKRFKAACSERAVNCQYTMFGTSDIGRSFNVVELGGPMPWEDMARYIERSPLTYAKDVVTPLLIIHSEDDLRCPIEQGEQLFVALKKLRREVRFIRFPGENHEMSRSGKPRHRLERFRHILEWFAHLPEQGHGGGYDEDLRRCSIACAGAGSPILSSRIPSLQGGGRDTNLRSSPLPSSGLAPAADGSARPAWLLVLGQLE